MPASPGSAGAVNGRSEPLPPEPPVPVPAVPLPPVPPPAPPVPVVPLSSPEQPESVARRAPAISQLVVNLDVMFLAFHQTDLESVCPHGTHSNEYGELLLVAACSSA